MPENINIEQVNIQKTSTPRVKIDRPKKAKAVEPAQTQKSSTVDDHTDKKVDVDVKVESVESVDTFIKNVQWGDYDVAFLVETLLKLSSVITGIDLFPYQQALQKRVFWSILLNDGATITGLISRQGGKSQTIACTITTLCVVMPSLATLFPEQLGVYKNGFWVGIYAPVAEQAETLYAKVRATAKSTHAQEIYKDPGIDTKLELHGCKWTNGSYVHRQTASPKAHTESKTWHLCLTGDTEVKTPQGIILLKDIQIGEQVVSLNLDTTQFEIDQVSHFFMTGTNKVYEITLSTGEKIKATASHKFYSTEGWLTVSELTKKHGIKLCIYEYQTTQFNPRISTRGYEYEQNISEKSKTSRITQLETKRVCGLEIRDIKNYCRNTSTKKSKWRKRGIYISFRYSVGRRIINILQYLLLRQRKEKSNKRMGRYADPGSYRLLDYGRWRITAKNYTNDFYALFFTRRTESFVTTFTRIWRNRISTRRQKNSKIFYSFSFRGTKQNNRNNQTLYNSNVPIQNNSQQNREELYYLWKIIHGCNNFCSVLSRMSSNSKKKIQSIFSFKWLQSKSSKQNLSQIHRAKQREIQGVQKEESRVYEKLQQDVQRENEELKFSEIVSISEVGEMPTYDITVEKNHNFIANNIIAHNCIMEESQDLTEEVIDQKLMPMVAWTNGTTVMIGTVIENKCPFYYQIERNREDDLYKEEHLKTHIAFDYMDVVKYNARYAKHVETAIRKFGKDSKYFKMSYGLEWQFSVTQPITYESLIKYTYAPKTAIVKYSDDAVVVSIDVAKSKDLTITTVSKITRVYMEYEDGVFEYAQAVQLLNWLSTGNMKYTQQRPIIKDFLLAYPNIIAIVVDTTGVGSAVYEEMQREWQFMCEWYPYVFSPKSKQVLSQLFEEYFYSNRLIVPSDEEAKKSEHQKALLRQSTTMKKISNQNCTYFTSQTEQTNDDYFWSWLLGIYGTHQVISNGMNVESTPMNNYRPSFQVVHRALEDRRAQVRNGEHLQISMRDQRLQKWGF